MSTYGCEIRRYRKCVDNTAQRLAPDYTEIYGTNKFLSSWRRSLIVSPVENRLVVAGNMNVQIGSEKMLMNSE